MNFLKLLNLILNEKNKLVSNFRKQIKFDQKVKLDNLKVSQNLVSFIYKF